MSSTTTNLSLLKKDPLTDGNDTFNIKTMLNDNWDAIDAFAGQTTPITRGGTGATTADTARANLGIPAAVQNILTTGGYSKIQVGSYVGTGTYGADNPCSLTFDGKPALFTIVSMQSPAHHGGSSCVYGQYILPVSTSDALDCASASWDGNTVAYYNKKSATYQFNDNGVTYVFAAVLE